MRKKKERTLTEKQADEIYKKIFLSCLWREGRICRKGKCDYGKVLCCFFCPSQGVCDVAGTGCPLYKKQEEREGIESC